VGWEASASAHLTIFDFITLNLLIKLGVSMNYWDIAAVVFIFIVFLLLGFALGVIYSHTLYFDFINSFCDTLTIDSVSNVESLVTP